MEITTVKQFITLVENMRKAQKRAKKTFADNDINDAHVLEKKVDKAIAEHYKRIYEEEESAQGRLFK